MLQIKKISKQYKTGDLIQKALDSVSLNLRDNEFVAILGPSGSGKTTLLNIIGGLDRYDQGDLIINGISTKKYKDRDWDSYRNHTIGFVFQSYNLIPHQNILSNVELALTISGVSKEKRKQKAIQALEKVGLKEHIHKKPNQLSGGQMQRVAIARALVNDPDILLADEPTGALDSETSVQVMDLLKEVAKDRLVVMVTHNPELAEQYATRIVNLKDGHIISDSDPFELEKNKTDKAQHKTMGKTSMSLLTSLSLSFNNLKTKKGRTILTSFAGSIGIIGIALILSLSNGVNMYIQSVEEDTLSEYPLTIQSSGIDMSSLISDASKDKGENSDEVKVTKTITNMLSSIGTNDLASLKEYLDSDSSNIKDYTNLIEYTYNVTPQIYSSSLDNIRQVNPDKSFSSLGIGSSSSSNSYMSAAMSTDVFSMMPSNTDLFSNQYDIKAGNWPTNYNECVLVLSSNGSISDFLLYTLGLRDSSELDQMIKQFADEEKIDVPDDISSYSYNDILGITFKLVNSCDYYSYDEEYKIWQDKSDNEDYLKKLIKNGEDLKIVGIVQPKEGASASMLTSGIYYPSSLITHIIEQAQESDVVKAQLKTPKKNIFTGESFDQDDNNENAFDISSVFSINTDAMKNAIKVDESKFNIDLSSLNKALSNVSLPEINVNEIIKQLNINITNDQINTIVNDLMSGYSDYVKEHPEADINQYQKDLSTYLASSDAQTLIQQEIAKITVSQGTISEEQIQSLMTSVLSNYEEYAKNNNLTDMSSIGDNFSKYIQSSNAQKIISDDISKIISETDLEKQITNILNNYTKKATTSITSVLQKELQSSMSSLGTSMSKAISFDANAFSNAIEMKMTQEDLSKLLTTMMSTDYASYENNLQTLGYADFDEPSGINIYPKDFESKEEVLNILDNYNELNEKNGDDDKVITYTDIVGTLMSSVTDIVNVISYVLVAFVAISLVVSSIMIGVITYISVLERKKEIGILRAIGASKHNISQVFNAETFIIGLFAGLIGIGLTLLLLIPGNMIIHSVAGRNDINASLPITAAIVLILLSVVLTLIGGIIPSRKAAKEDPVTALRTE
jgi:ABC-type lipoprotein export system ATPase subunit/ABC-type antimicrobial peptide transport system permease subunit